MILRNYQARAVRQTRAALSERRAVVLAMQVGAGKTIVACEMIRLALQKGRRTLFLVHRVELLDQACNRLGQFGIPAGVIKAGYAEDRGQPVQVASIPSLVRRELPPADFVVMDECHHAVSDSWMRVAKHYLSTGAHIVGITATPQRLDGRGLGEVFERIVTPVTTAELIDAGHLIEPIVYAPPTADFSGVRRRAGEYALPELAKRMEGLTGEITVLWQKHCKGRPTLCFAVNIEHSRQIQEALLSVGASAEHIDGRTPMEQRVRLAAALGSHEVGVVSQCALWGEGVDIPGLQALIIARPTLSLGLHRQMVGRVMRPAKEKSSAIILDHAGNHHRHGMISEEIEWSLDARTQRSRESLLPVRACAVCYAVLPPGARECPECGAQAAPETKTPGVDNEGVLVRLKPSGKTQRRDDYRGLVLRADRLGYSLGWARLQYKATYGKWPRFRDIEQEEYACQRHVWEYKVFGPKKVSRCKNCYLAVDETLVRGGNPG